jgi:prepilin-type N-terminal cleavage/methylation domain-containing protein
LHQRALNKKPLDRAHRERGFSAVEIIIAMAVVTIMGGFAVMNIVRARENMRLINAAHELQANVERARADAVRRHDTATVQVLDATRYQLIMDFNGRGTLDVNGDNAVDTGDTRIVTLPVGVNFVTEPLPAPAQFDWRGRVGANVTMTLVGVDGQGQPTGYMPPITINMSAGGDININNAPTNLPQFHATPFATPMGAGSPTPTPTP